MSTIPQPPGAGLPNLVATALKHMSHMIPLGAHCGLPPSVLTSRSELSEGGVFGNSPIDSGRSASTTPQKYPVYVFKSVAEKANIEKLLEIYEEKQKQKRLRRSASTTED